jgi:CHAD domain-containing protein
MNLPSKQEAKTCGDWSYLAIAKHFQKILKHEEGVLQDKEPEELHQMRVGMRRLRSTMVGFAPTLELPEVADEKSVGKVARILGKLRDLDVLKETLEKRYFSLLEKKEQKRLKKALKILEKRRKRTFKEVEAVLKDKLYLNLKENFQAWLKQPTYQEIAQIAIATVLPDLLFPQASKLLLHPAWLLGTKFIEGEIKFNNDWNQKQVEKILSDRGETLHDLRKEAKRSRYNMELFTQFYSNSYENHLNEIKNLQTVLGDIQDSFILAEFLSSVLAEDYEEEMPELANILSKNRFDAWQKWEGLRQKFLNPQIRSDFHTTLLSPDRLERFIEL